MIRLTCPNCGTKYRVEADIAGKKVKCQCGKSYRVAKITADEESSDRMRRYCKNLELAVRDHDHGTMNTAQLLAIFQYAIMNGDILEPTNELAVVAFVTPLIDNGVLSSSDHVATFEERMNKKMRDYIKKRP